jgi:hypothetical protein
MGLIEFLERLFGKNGIVGDALRLKEAAFVSP